MSFLNNAITGVSLGSIYAIIALGYTMVYGIAKMLNFAHGDVIMVGAYVCFFAISSYHLNPVVGVLLAMLVCTVLGMVIERLAYKPLRQATSLAVLITAIGVSYFLQSLALLIFGSNQRKVESVITMQPVRLGAIELTGESAVTIGVTVIIMICLTLFINKTKTGRAMLAVSEDKGAAQLMGVNVNKTISVTFAIGSALAAVA